MFQLERTFTRGMSLGRRRAAGDDDRGSILFIHGLGESGLCFEDLCRSPHLEPWHLIIPDIPGYGRSPWPRTPLSLEDQADLLAEWAAYEIDGPVFLAGHSMGGVVALILAERHPKAVRALINIDGNISSGDCVFSGRAARQSLDEFLGGGFAKLRETIHRQGSNDPALRGYHVSLNLCNPETYYRNSVELVRESQREDLARRMAALDIPHRYLAGLPKGVCPRSRELLDDAGVPWQAIEPSGHWPFIDKPAEFATALGNFLNEV